jgi:8-oxo-dGTP diphosphatase
MHVAVAAILDDQHRVLLSKRPAGVHQGGLWEFPGGKLEAEENVVDALGRELYEELGIRPTNLRPLIRVTHDYTDKAVLLDVWCVTVFSGEPLGREGQPIRWVPVGQLADYEFPVANQPILAALTLPDRYLVTPEPGEDIPGFLAGLERSLASGLSLVQFRARQLSRDRYRALLPDVIECCNRFSARVLLNAEPALAEASGAAGVHLNSERLMALSGRPLSGDYLVAASCHDEKQLLHAQQLGVDFVVVSPVRPTASHPGVNTLGFSGLHALAEQAAIPVYALGGMQTEHLMASFEHGAQGIAAIRGLWRGSNQLS